MIDSLANIRALPSAALLVTFNNLSTIVDDEEIKRFASRDIGVSRTLKLLDRVAEYRTAESLPAVLVLADGSLTTQEELDKKAAEAAAKVAEAAAQATAKAKSASRAPSFGDSDVILLKVAAGTNPKKATAADRFAHYASGVTVAEYAAAVGSEKQAIRDLLWDTKKGWVAVVGAKSASGKAALAARAAASAPAN